MGLDIAKAILAAGHQLVATGRNPERVAKAVGDSKDLLAVKLDVTAPADAVPVYFVRLECFPHEACVCSVVMSQTSQDIVTPL
jgi:NAD(P)-dependent dehydrogenase (short-subunit alcohol dehydrogenase family)